jgi:neutral trehalase
MATYHLNLADEHLLDQVLEPETLAKHVPRMETFFEGIQEMRSLQAEISSLGDFTRRTGFTPGKNFQRIATIPYSVKAAIEAVDEGFFQNKDKVLRFLQRHPEYDTRSKLG